MNKFILATLATFFIAGQLVAEDSWQETIYNQTKKSERQLIENKNAVIHGSNAIAALMIGVLCYYQQNHMPPSVAGIGSGLIWMTIFTAWSLKLPHPGYEMTRAMLRRIQDVSKPLDQQN